MFKTLEIKNFKSIAHAVFDLGKINVLTGQSNLGKSNVVQAIYCLTHNHWDSNYMKWGEKRCVIRLTDETGEWVEYRHNESSAEYSLSTVDQPFTKIGRDVPQPVRDFLNMNEVQFDEDLSLDFNFERQFDPSFVISLSGFELAKVFGKLMNLDIVMSAARTINKDLAANKKSVEGQEAIENVSIEYIQKNYPIELKYALLHEAIKIDAKAERLDHDAGQLQSILTDLEYYQECVKAYSSFLDSDASKQIDSLHEPIQGLDNVLCSIIMAQEASQAYSSFLSKEMPEFDFVRFTGLSDGLMGLFMNEPQISLYQELLSKVSAIDFEKPASLGIIKGVLDSKVQWDVELNSETTRLKKADEAIQKKTQEFSDFLKEHNVCPISGKPFADGCVAGIVAGV